MTNPFRFSVRSIRGKMTLAAVTPLVVILVLVALAASYLINASIFNQTQKQMRNDLNSARVVLNQHQQRVREMVRFTARSSTLLNAMAQRDRLQLEQELSLIRSREQLDMFNVTDMDGRSLLSQTPAQPADFIKAALSSGQYHGTVLLSAGEMARESLVLAERAQIYDPYHPETLVEQRGMFLVAASRIVNASGEPIGCLYAGILLNNNVSLTDRISELLYGAETFEGIGIGSATIFLDKLRIATTIRLKNGQRAIGTQLSSEVAESVSQRSEFWLARALVVNDWYLTAYGSILDDRSRVIGALYVGMLEKPLTAVKHRSFLALFALLIFGCLFGCLLAGLFARRLSRPVLELARSAEKIAGGERQVPLPVAGSDEIGHLTAAFADMTTALKKSDDELQNLNRQLENKVEQRTGQLEEKTVQLIKAQQQLVRHEKLAAIGSLATGVAHEINNPAAIIRGNAEILQMSLSAEAEEQEEVQEILKQVERVSLITRNLLNFAGKQDLAAERVQITELLDDILAQIGHQQPLGQVQLCCQYESLPPIPGDQERLRQVFTNIILNALQAMQGEGELSVVGHCDAENVVISIADSGPGVSDEKKEKIFNPFFSTKKQGTGLGLSISYGIVQAHGGSIELIDHSLPGACFQVSLPLD
jgi:C4-dicarboxylate-specific signal transduction histidine kinase